MGALSVSVIHNGMWTRLCEAPGHAGAGGRPALCHQRRAGQNREALIPLLEARFKKKAAWQWEEALRAHGVPCAQYRRDTPRTHYVKDHPQTRANRMMDTVETPWGACNVSRAQWRFSRDSTAIARPAPRLGEHQQEILHELGITDRSRASAA